MPHILVVLYSVWFVMRILSGTEQHVCGLYFPEDTQCRYWVFLENMLNHA